MAASPRLTPDERSELERRLGEPFALDGSYGSLWAVEILLRSSRRLAALRPRVAWVCGYVSSVLQRGYRESGLAVDATDDGSLRVAGLGFVTPLTAAIDAVLSAAPPGASPRSAGELSPVLGAALAPRYALEALSLGQPSLSLAEARHGRALERIIDWLVAEALRSAVGSDREQCEAGYGVARALIVPPWGYLGTDGSSAVRTIEGLLAEERTARSLVLRALSLSQDLSVAVLAARACVELGVAPTTVREARAIRRALRHFGALPGARPEVLAAMARLLPQSESPIEGVDHPRYLEADAAFRTGQLERALGLLDELVRQQPQQAAYWCYRGLVRDRLGRAARESCDDYDQAISLRPDYWQALINRGGLLTRTRRYAEADRDLFLAFALRPDCDDTRNNLLVNYLLRPPAGRRATADEAAEKAPPAGRPAAEPPVAAAREEEAGARPAAASGSSEDEADWRQYEVIELLGAGGMGKVYRVRHLGWGMELALKIPRVELLERGGVAGFVAEAEAWSRLGAYPHTVDCYYVRMRRGVPWLFAELVDGGSLGDWIAKGRLRIGEGGKSPGEALGTMIDLGLQMAYGLGHAHDHNLIHQDMKPANVILTKEGIAKVTDFGLAKAGRASSAPATSGRAGKTLMAEYAGMTPAYCSPEQAAASRSDEPAPLTRRTDVWSWAVTVLEMFAGQVRWLSGVLAPAALRGYVADGGWDERLPLMPPALVSLLERCFAPDEAERPADMLTIAAELRALYCEVTGAAQARPQPTRLGEVADVLNNRGASLVDLGRAAEAVGVFRKAVEADPHHLEASYNLALLDWRHALIDDEEAVARLESAASAQPESSQGQLLCAWIHYERADREQVRACLARALGKEAPTAPAPKRISELCDRASAGYQVDELRPLPSVARALAISRDELVAASAHDDGVRVWWLPSPHELQGCALGARLLALSPEAHVAVAADETTVACWRPRGAREHVLALGPVRALTTCGEELAVVAVADRCVLIDAEDGAHRDIPGRFGTVADLATSADGRLFAVASEDGTVKLVTISGHFVRTLHHEEPVESVALSADGRHAVTGSWDGQRSLYRLSVWDTTSGTLLRRLGEPAPRRAVVSNDGRHVLSWDAVGTLRLWDATTGRSLRTARPLGGVTAVASSDGDPAVVAQGERLLRVQVLHRAPAAAVMVARPPHSDLLEARHAAFRAAIAHAEDTLATSDVTGALRLLEQAAEVPGYRHHWQVRALGAQLAGRTARSALRGSFAGPSVRDLGGPVQGVSLSPDGERLVTVAFDAATRSIEVQRHDTRRGEPLRVMRLGEQPGPFRAAAVASDRPIVATACGSEVRLWDLEAAGVLGVAGEHRPRALALSADGRYLLLVEDAATTVLDIARVRWLEPFACPAALAVAIADGSDRVVVATASEVALYSLASRRRLRALTGHASPGARVAIEPTATAAAVVHASGRVAFLDPEAGVATVAATVRGATAMALCDDGAAVAIGDAGGGVHIFDAAAEDPVCLGRHRNEVLSVAITPDAWLVASGGRDAEVRLWHLEWRRLPPPADGLRRARRWLELYLARREQARSGLPSAGNERGWDPDELAERSRQLGRLGFGAHSPAILEEALDELSAGRRAG